MYLSEYFVRVKIWKEKKTFVIEAIDFPLVSEGESFNAAAENFVDAFNLSINEPQFRKLVESQKISKTTQSIDLELNISYAGLADFNWEKINQIA